MKLDLLMWHIEQNEGFKSKVYKCPAGKLTIGYGRNLEDNGISKQEALVLLESDIMNIKLELEDKLSFFYALDDIRQNVLIEMAYNMGVPNLLKFKKTLESIEKHDFLSASKEMLNSKWHKDFIKYNHNEDSEDLRSRKLSKIMEIGEYYVA